MRAADAKDEFQGEGLSRKRTFLLTQDGAPLKLPSDLLGVTELRYAVGSATTKPDVSAACDEIMTAVRQAGPK
jgi:predicted nucleotide-binding protein